MNFGIHIDDGSEVLSDFAVESNTSSVELYDWQREALTYFFKNNCNAIYECATGTGKTFFAIEIIKQIWKEDPKCRVLIVVPKNVILETSWYTEIYSCGISLRDIGVYYGRIKEYGKITITNMQNLHRIALELFDCAIFDECFSGDTKIKYLENNKTKEIDIKTVVENKLKLNVISFNIKTKKIEYQKIINWFKIKEKRKVIDIELNDGTILTVTPEQLIYTKRGYVKAIELKNKDKILKW